jgi:hypothetical protein
MGEKMQDKPKGIALTIGLNSFDPNHYNGESGELFGCENDARDMADIAHANKFEVTTLLTKDATRNNVIEQISKAASALNSGDIFMITYSGHGGWLYDKNDDERDFMDETWCLYDGQLVDDEIYYLLSKFKPDVRIFVTSDSCHSGTITRKAVIEKSRVESRKKVRAIPRELARAVYIENKKFYDQILTDQKYLSAFEDIAASVLQISACQDDQECLDGDENGVFTKILLRVWDNGRFKPTGETEGYQAFYDAIFNRSPRSQRPNYFRVGRKNEEFEKQKPYTI